MYENDAFWTLLNQLIESSEIVIDRLKNTSHPRYPDFIYPVDYGFLKGTSAMDGGEIDIWRGTAANNGIIGIICTVDIIKRDSEMKILYNCSEDEVQKIYALHNETHAMKGILIRRNEVLL